VGVIPHSDETQRLTRNPEPQFDFWTDADEFDVRTERVGKEGIALVPAVESDLLPEKAR
jgi:hypothetical protein